MSDLEPAPAVSTPPGWYPTPQGVQRYWDGVRWTEHVAPVQRRVVTDQRQYGAGAIVLAWLVTVLLAGYMLPWAIALTRGKANASAVGVVNLLTGWTIIGWIVSLVMACAAHQIASA